MKISCITLMPKMFGALQDDGIVGRALNGGLANLETISPRQFVSDVHKTVDDRPYGGGPGMVMKAEPLLHAIEFAKQQHVGGAPVILLSPQGEVFTQVYAERLAQSDGFVLVAGRYEGIDERVVDLAVDAELSIGDFVLSGGELAAMVVIDSVVRLLPGAMSNQQSSKNDSFGDQLLDHPHYTRPEVIVGNAVPDVLISGDHKRIDRWRLKQALGRTWQRRPHLLKKRGLNELEKTLLKEFLEECSEENNEN